MDRQSVARTLAELRQARGGHYSQADLAAATGLDPGHISRLERGDRMPSLDVLARLAPGYGLTPGQLIDLLTEGVIPETPQVDPLQGVSRALRAGPWDTSMQHAILELLLAPRARQAALLAAFDAGVEQLLGNDSIAAFDEILVTSGPAGGRDWLAARLTALRYRLAQGECDEPPVPAGTGRTG